MRLTDMYLLVRDLPVLQIKANLLSKMVVPQKATKNKALIAYRLHEQRDLLPPFLLEGLLDKLINSELHKIAFLINS